MYLFVPSGPSNLAEFVDGLTLDKWRQWIVEFRAIDDVVDNVLKLPRFRIEYDSSLASALIALGIGSAFEPDADFSGMADGVSISDVLHETFVEVNEVGTEAAAATVVRADTFGPSRFVADRPFFFAIHDDDTGTVLFSGLVYESEDPGRPEIGMVDRHSDVDPSGKLPAHWGELKASD